jgi:hypothetical protein
VATNQKYKRTKNVEKKETKIKCENKNKNRGNH